jgi:hypothetical protein
MINVVLKIDNKRVDFWIKNLEICTRINHLYTITETEKSKSGQ